MRTGDKAWLRVLDGQFVIFIGFLAGDRLAVSVDGSERVLARSYWRSLPVYSGWTPCFRPPL